MKLIKMIKSGLVNQRLGGGFEKGYPHQEYPKGRDEFIRPYVADDKTILKKSSYSSPLDYKAVTPSPVDYNDIFGRKSTPDERLYILKQIQQGLDKIQKGILGKVSGIPSAPSATTPTNEIGQPITIRPVLPLPDVPAPEGFSNIANLNPPPLQGQTPATDIEMPIPEPVPDVNGRFDQDLLPEEEVSVDVVTPAPYFTDQFNSALMRDAIERQREELEAAERVSRQLEFNANPLTEFDTSIPTHMFSPFSEPAKSVISDSIESNGVGPRSRSSEYHSVGSGSSALTSISELKGRLSRLSGVSKRSIASLNVPLINTQNLSSGHQPGHIGDYGSGPTRLNEDITISQMIPRRNPPRGLNAADLAAAATRLKKPKVVPKKEN